MAWLKLVRWPNLVIVALTQCLIYFVVLLPAYQAQNTVPFLSPFLFFLLVLTTVLIAAGGYIINDIVDYDMDIINKPDKVFIGSSIQQSVAQNAYWACVGIGFLLAFYIGLQTDNLKLLVIYPLAVLLLYRYSTHFKKMPFLGNFVVALFCAFVPMIVLIAVYPFPNPFDQHLLVLWYAIFAFLTTLIREIIKDIEDIEGDKIEHCKTIPIVFGIKKATYFALFWVVLLILELLLLSNSLLYEKINAYISLILLLPILYIFIQLMRAKSKQDYSHLSLMIKLLMLMGLLCLFFF